jgi:hypothetical protein
LNDDYPKRQERLAEHGSEDWITLFALSNLWEAQRALTVSAGGVRP